MKTQHTPTPWQMKITDTCAEQTGLIMGAGGLSQVCDTGIAYWHNAQARGVDCADIVDQCKADAALICAAPELLEALKGLMLWAMEDSIAAKLAGTTLAPYEAARAALKKAAGDQYEYK